MHFTQMLYTIARLHYHMKYYSPQEIDDFVESILNKIDAEFDPELIPVKPETYCKPLNCYINVDKKIEKDGGKPHYGWAILRGPFMCEAERHAVWESSANELIDVTPRERIQSDQIMFVSDNDFVYSGQLVDNVRVNVTNNKVVDHTIRACEILEFFYSYGERIDDDKMHIDPEIGKTIAEYEQLKNTLFGFLEAHGKMNSKCICNGSKNYKNCHGKTIIKRMEEDQRRIHAKFGLPK